MTRFFIRLLLIISFAISLGVIGVSISIMGFKETETWAVIAAVLAVITAILSAWSTQRSLELQEDALKAYPYPYIDVKSRYSLMQLRVKNFGGSIAHDIKIKWNSPPLLNRKGEEAHFTEVKDASDIAVLLPGESVAVLIDASMQAYTKNQDMNYSGEIEFRNASGRKRKHPFFISAEPYRHTLLHEEEQPKTLRDIQKIPDELEKINSKLSGIQLAINNLVEVEKEDD